MLKIIKRLLGHGIRKALIITGACLVAVILLVVILNFALFRTKNFVVSLGGDCNFTSETILSSDFNKNSTLLSFSKKNVAAQIEKNVPYAKVTDIEYKFPNTVYIYVVSRKAVFVCQKNEKFFLLDEELKVLESVGENVSGLILLETDESLIVGEKIQNFSVPIKTAFNALKLKENLENVSEFSLITENAAEGFKDFLTLKITINSVKFFIYDVENSLKEKVNAFLKVCNVSQEQQGHYTIFCDQNSKVCAVYVLD